MRWRLLLVYYLSLDCGFWVLSRVSFNEFANEVAKGEFSENYQFFKKVKLFEYLTPD